ncbi:penicillin-binding protein [Deinococcus sp. KNUC1210]|uniref:transglycosylase domain-containing protein n=1 Tax=Deinococcus sp. KNUC1210 TaxID=2917691 RepID=UPI001EF0EF32|nr:transglycosylase domain-containing protein [Deinococcus sp. KNUC1210]ULH14812.1 penicillin-binding protein [Deinococcus sp. KNUC1210]
MVGRFFRFFFSLLLALCFVALALIATFGLRWSRNLPDYRALDSLTLGSVTQVYARDGTPLGTLAPKIGETSVSRTLVSLDNISPYMTAALISNEDRHFFEHYGLDPNGIARQFRRLSQNENVQGGSTLTNQLVKNTLLADYQNARTAERKVKEWLLSVQVERSFTKQEILQDYLNIIYWGDGGPVELYGIYSAAQAYFGKTPKQLDLAESTYLTTLIPGPGLYYPNYTRQRPLMKALLGRMVEDKWVTQAQADAAWREKLQPRGWQVRYDESGSIVKATLIDRKQTYLRAVTTSRAPHFMQQVQQELIARFGRDKIYGSGGLRVYTTLDPKAQSAVEAASRSAKVPPGTTLAAVISDPYTGDVLGMVGQKLVGSKPPADWNNAAQGQRQIGSSIKPLLYTTALSTGITQLDRYDDTPISFPCPSCQGGKYEPKDFEGEMTGRAMSLREALDRSLNLPTVRLADKIGLPTFFDKLKELNIPPNDGTGLAAALGAVETTPVKMAAAYAPFANGGIYRPPRYVTRVLTARGELLYDSDRETTQPHRIWTPQVAYLGLNMIEGVVDDLGTRQGGFSEPARIPGWSVGGKTGTSTGPKDLWFVGVNPYYVGAVWIGKQQGGNMATNIYSGVWAPPVWRDMMVPLLQGKPVRDFAQPPGIVFEPHPDSGPYTKVKVALLDPAFQNAANVTPDPTPQLPQYSEATLPPADSSGVVVNLDSQTQKLATEFTPPGRIVQRRVSLQELPSFAPDPNPQPLKEQTADPATVKAMGTGNGTTDGIPNAPKN